MSWNPKLPKVSMTRAAPAAECNVNCHSSIAPDPKQEFKNEFVDEFKHPPAKASTPPSLAELSRQAVKPPAKPNWKHQLADLGLDFLLTLKGVPERRPWERKRLED